MIKVDNDVYDDEFFDSLIQQDKKIEQKAKELGLTMKEAKILMKEASADTVLQKAKIASDEAERMYKALGQEEKAFECRKISKHVMAVLNMGRSERPAPGAY